MPAPVLSRTDSRSAALLLALWAVVGAAGLAHGLGRVPLVDPDEGRNAEVAREMAAGGDYVLPHLDGLPYLDKPVLYFAAAAVAIDGLGAGETAARLPALLAALATALLTGWFAVRLFGRGAGWPAAIAAGSAPLAVAFARIVIFDSLLSLLVTVALAALYFAVEAARPGARARDYLGWTLLAWAAMALGVLTKGPVALVVPLLVATPFALWRRGGRAVWHPLGIALLAVVVGPWVWAVSRRIPEFLDYALVTESWRRLTTPELKRTGPWWTFVPVLLGGTLPWSLAAAGGWL
jgi:4-amino-4-deoxy-L-arabinose transferase-like glycosyltransferase